MASSHQTIDGSRPVTRPQAGSGTSLAERRRGRRRLNLAPVWAIFVFWSLLAAVLYLLWSGAQSLYHGNRILPGARSLGLELGGSTEDEGSAALGAAWAGRRVELRAGGRAWTLGADQVGFHIDAAAAAREAYNLGRGEVTLSSLPPLGRKLLAQAGQDSFIARDLLAAAGDDLTSVETAEVQPTLSFDRATASAILRMIGGQVDIEAQDAGIAVVDGRIETRPAAAGQALDVTGSLIALESIGEALLSDEAALKGGRLDLPVVPIVPVVTDVSPLVQELAPLLETPIPLSLWDPISDQHLEWQATPEDMGKWVSFGVSPDDPSKLTWTVDEERITEFVQAQEDTLGEGRTVQHREAVPALLAAFRGDRSGTIGLRVFHADRFHEVRSGETLSSIAYDYGMPYAWILAVNTDLGDILPAGQQLRIPTQDIFLPLDPVEHKRIVVGLSEQRVRAYENGELKWDWPASTGLPESPTSPGIFQVQTHDTNAYAANWDLWMPYFMGIYRPIPGQDFMNGFHGFPSRDQRQILWTNNLGKPITYGCILVSTEDAQLLYDWADEGVIVEIAR